MSAPGSSNARRAEDWPSRFTRGAGFASLALGLVTGPLAALINEQAIYAGNMWMCGHGLKGALHLIPVLSLVVVAAMTITSHRNWVAVGAGAGDEEDSVATRTRFLAMLGMAVSIFSGIVIIAQWLGIFMYNPCERL